MNISTWLAQASDFLISVTSTPRLEAEVLLAYRLGEERTALLTMQGAELKQADEEWLQTALEERSNHVPLAYILGYKDFADFRVKVTPDVLIPRPETESIVTEAIEIAHSSLTADSPIRHSGLDPESRNQNQKSLTIYEIGTGSGAIAIGLARALPHARIVASDISATALAVARENIDALGLADRIEILQSDLGDHISHARLLVANLPYLPTSLLVSEDVKNEPAIALWSGADGLDHYRRLFSKTSFDVAVIELGADQYRPLSEWIGANLRSKSVQPISDIGGTLVGMIVN